MIDFLYSLNKALKEESDIYVSYRKRNNYLEVKVFDFKKRGINMAKIYLNNHLEGYTNNKGILLINHKIPKKAVLKAELGIYLTKREIIP
ncbi:MAG: hypothetical protein WC393_04745 [Candidatus Nanoarchaeia archaeon]|jgi:hypothetical protein